MFIIEFAKKNNVNYSKYKNYISKLVGIFLIYSNIFLITVEKWLLNNFAVKITVSLI